MNKCCCAVGKLNWVFIHHGLRKALRKRDVSLPPVDNFQLILKLIGSKLEIFKELLSFVVALVRCSFHISSFYSFYIVKFPQEV